MPNTEDVYMVERLGRVEVRLEHVEIRLERVEIKVDRLEVELMAVEQRLGERIDALADRLDTRLNGQGRRLDEHDRKLDEHGRKLDEHGRKLDAFGDLLQATSVRFDVQLEQMRDENRKVAEAMAAGFDSVLRLIEESRRDSNEKFAGHSAVLVNHARRLNALERAH